MDMPVSITGLRKDLGGFEVARLLPHRLQRSVGPFVFLDHMGPAQFAPGQGIDVRPHPHIGLATVTFLFEGALMHRDSLGSAQEILPGDVNWMNAGRGIVHSERSPDALRASGGPLHGLQAWVALPLDQEESAPAFNHYPSSALPRIDAAGVSLQLIAGEVLGRYSPVRTLSELFYLAGTMDCGAELPLPPTALQQALYVVRGGLRIEGQLIPAGTLQVLPQSQAVQLRAEEDTLLAWLGGPPLTEHRQLWWNFVSSRPERIEQAKSDWRQQRFDRVPGEHEFIPLPE
jgi:redox-sensitive bicupin YhaK (pirin superfamily)